ncbi:hypothetical protein [Nocardiopsis sp. FR6]|uniref:hypothetical protein n=1 Tax=Nocardiopsis sp. FR6 TaxID=2605986 RepID=UPI0013577D58|nr:hypothetical protein [Nocardiopsis sp. FR6]
MIVLVVLFGAVVAGPVVLGVLALRARRAAGALSAAVARTSEEFRTSGADLRERVGRGGAGT